MAIKIFTAIQKVRPEYIRTGIDKIKSDYGILKNYLEKGLEINSSDLIILWGRVQSN